MKLIEIIKSELANNINEIPINYSCHTTSCNDEYIIVNVGSKEYTRISGSYPNPFVKELNTVIAELQNEYPMLHTVITRKEFHFYYSGFNSCSTEMVPTAISNSTPANEVKKTGIVTESYKMVGLTKVMEVISNHQGYELYKRSGFSFRGAQESRTDIEGIKRLCEWAACCDVEVIDNEIHVNGFSCNDMW